MCLGRPFRCVIAAYMHRYANTYGQKISMHRIIVVGGGAGGLELASKLGKSLGRRGLAEITLVDHAMTHLWKPLLHEIAAGTRNPAEDELDYLAQAQRCHFRFRLGRLDAVDRERREVRMAPILDSQGEPMIAPRSFAYDTLVIAIGSVTNSFGIEGVDEHCWFLDNRAQADEFHKHLLERFLRAHAQPEAIEEGDLHIGIVGAGATGVELSAELYETAEQLVAYGLDKITPEHDVTLHIIEAGPKILPALPEHVSDGVRGQLDKLGIQVHVEEQVTKVTPQGLYTKSGKFISAGIKVWAAGIKGADVLTQLDGLETNRANQLLVRATLQTTIDDNIFAFGDCAACTLPNSEALVPPRAQAAHQQAAMLATSIRNRIKGDTLPEYVYKDFGSLVSLSAYSTIGNLMGNLTGDVMISGKFARFIYVSLYRMHLMALYGPLQTTLKVLSQWLGHGLKPRLKLH